MRIVADIQNNSKIILCLLCPCYGIGSICMVYATFYKGLRITDVMSNKDCQVKGGLFWITGYRSITIYCPFSLIRYPFGLSLTYPSLLLCISHYLSTGDCVLPCIYLGLSLHSFPILTVLTIPLLSVIPLSFPLLVISTLFLDSLLSTPILFSISYLFTPYVIKCQKIARNKGKPLSLIAIITPHNLKTISYCGMK